MAPGVFSKWWPLEGSEHIVILKYILKLRKIQKKGGGLLLAGGHSFMTAFRKFLPTED